MSIVTKFDSPKTLQRGIFVVPGILPVMGIKVGIPTIITLSYVSKAELKVVERSLESDAVLRDSGCR